MGVLMLASYALPPGWGAALLEAASKAGFVGGIADWFAVTALFRHPLGLPIPHTAIIPREKDRLGRALGRFVASHVFTGPEVSNVLARLDVPGILRRFLSDPSFARPAAQSVAGTLPRVLGSLEDGRAQRMMAHLIPRIVGGAAAGQIVARALRGMVEGGRHQEVFGFVLTQLRELIAEKEMTLETAIEERVREQGGRLLGWAVGAAIARRVMSVVMAELDKMSPDGSELRAAFDEWVRREIERMETDPERAKEVGMALRKVVAHETVHDLGMGYLVPAARSAGSRRAPTGWADRRRDRRRTGQSGDDSGNRSGCPRTSKRWCRPSGHDIASGGTDANIRFHRLGDRQLGRRDHH